MTNAREEQRFPLECSISKIEETGVGISEHRGQEKCQAGFQGSMKNDMDLFIYVCFFEM